MKAQKTRNSVTKNWLYVSEHMRQRGEWMVPADDGILEYIRDAGEVPPAVVARNVNLNRHYAGERCRELAEYGLLDRLEDGYYRLTDVGNGYLAEEIDADTLEPE